MLVTNAVIGRLGKLVHKQNCSHDFFLNSIYNIIIIKVRYITIETKEVTRIAYKGFLYPLSYSGDHEGIGVTHLGLHPSTHA